MMARLNTQIHSSDADAPDSPGTSEERRRLTSSTPGTEFEAVGSDKENQRTTKPAHKNTGKRSSGIARMSEQNDAAENSRHKRQKIDQVSRARPPQSQAAHRQELQERVDTTYYDPDQDEAERRATKRSLRELTSKVNDSRAEFLQPGSKGIENTLAEADEIYKNVKQTSVATIDSRLLVTVGDLAYKKVNTLTLGDSSTGIDVDDFVTRCIRFMNENVPPGERPNGTQASSSQARRPRRPQADEDEDDAEPMNWAHLGQKACFLYNSRPCLTGFLLGPLSVQKKVRQQTQRRAREARADPSQVTRPLELAAEDLEKEETANLTVICREIAKLLEKFVKRAEQRVEQEYEAFEGEPTEKEMRDLFARHGITDNGCVPLFHFCVNPKSFGQTVENMFYVSFLIKEGRVGLDFDSNGLPTIGIAEQRTLAERQEAQRNQAVFTLDFDIWQELIDAFGIKQSIIPHRKEEHWDDGTLQEIAETVGANNDNDDDDDFNV